MTTIVSTELVQIRFTVDGDFTDALYFTPDEYANLQPADLEAMQLVRHARWKAITGTVEPDENAKKAELSALVLQRAALDARIDDLAAEAAESIDIAVK